MNLRRFVFELKDTLFPARRLFFIGVFLALMVNRFRRYGVAAEPYDDQKRRPTAYRVAA